MAASTPRRIIAEDASYGKISTPDGSRYESATAELGGMLTKEGADIIPTSEEMINVLAADRLKLQTVSSQLFDRDQFIRQFADRTLHSQSHRVHRRPFHLLHIDPHPVPSLDQ